MAELSIEEKAKAYDEAIEQAEKELTVCRDMNCDAARQIFRLFPQLAESEDERIRKALIRFHKSTIDVDGIKGEDIIDWLEKQGKSALEAIDNIDDKEYCCILKKQDKSGLEAIKEEKVDNANKVEPKDYNSIDPYFGKPADKIEPKFHEGDWVVQGCNILKIKGVGATHYCYETISGYVDDMLVSEIDSQFHLWAVEDAKPGDVLVCCDNKPFIFKGFFGLNFPNCLAAYCGITLENQFRHCSGKTFWTNQDVKPATKGQIDLLFAKMQEAGYEWDAKKKELKKIDSKPIFDVEIPFGAKDSELEEVFYSIPNGFHAEIEDDKVVIKKGKQKPWSEEDERMYRELHNLIYSTPYCDSRKELSDFLKSLKDRVQPQQEWSEEVEATITLLKDIAEEQEKDYCPHNANDLRKAAQYLETCRPQNTCKPSGEHYELEEFAKIVRCNLTGISKSVQQLFETKYLQLTGNKMYEGFKD